MVWRMAGPRVQGEGGVRTAELAFPVQSLRMTVSEWLEHAVRDATARGLPELRPMLEALVRGSITLRHALWNPDPRDVDPPSAD